MFEQYERFYSVITIIFGLTLIGCIICGYSGIVFKLFFILFIVKVSFHNGYIYTRNVIKGELQDIKSYCQKESYYWDKKRFTHPNNAGNNRCYVQIDQIYATIYKKIDRIL